MRRPVVICNKVTINDLGVSVGLVQSAGYQPPTETVELKLTSNK